MLYRRGRIWWTEFEHAGTRHRISTGEANYRTAAAQARRLRVEVEQKAGPGGRIHGIALDVLQGLDLERAEQRNLGKIRAKTITGLWSPLLRHLGARYDAARLALRDLDRYEGLRRAEGVRGQTIRREIQALVRGLGLAKRLGMIRALPFDPDDLRQITSDAPLSSQQAKAWSAAEIVSVFSNLSRKAVIAGWRDRLRLVQLTGLRLEELRRLEPSVWVRQDGLHIPAASSKTITGARTIPLGSEARAILSRWRRVRGKPNLALKIASERAGMAAVLTPRDLRAWYITQAGKTDPVAAQRLAGHTSIATTSRYLHADVDRLHAAANAALTAAGDTTLSPQNKSRSKKRSNIKSARSSFG